MTRPGRVAAALILVLLFLVGTVTAPLLHRLALVRRGRLSARLRDDAADAGHALHRRLRRSRSAGSLLNLRAALSSIGDLRPVFTTREGIEVTLPSGRQLRGLATGAAALLAVIVGLYAAGRWETWLTWRHGVPFGSRRSDSRPRRRVLRLLAALPAVRCAAWVRRSSCSRRSRPAALYLVSGSLSSGFPGRMSMTPAARRHLSLLVAVFLLLLAWGAWLHRAEHLLETSGADPRRQLRRRLRPHAGGAAAGRRGRRRRRARRAARVRRPRTGRSRPPIALYAGRVDRRRGLQHAAAALRRHAQRAGARDAVHPAQHRRDATRVRARHASRSAQSPATRG